jgi:anionic cell wall polymer biosynthesis LytR-Cps2A-Psr (LCP) family protein
MNNNNKIILIIILALFIVSIGTLIISKLFPNKAVAPIEKIKTTSNINSVEQTAGNIVLNNNAIEQAQNSNLDYSDLVNNEYEIDANNKTDLVYLVDKNAGSSKEVSTPRGKRISIVITGLDGRIGRLSKHADANHVIIVYPESGQIEIISIPRDTYVDMGYNDSTNLNKLTICRANKGRNVYLKEVAQIAKVPKIDYWVEFSFSQAMGIIEFLGFKNPTNTLQVLRSRKGLGGDDYQRCYTQGQFIRQAMLAHFNKFTGILGNALVRAGLLFVETNLTADVSIDMINKLEKAGFPKSELVNVKIRPPVNIKYKVYDFSDTTVVSKLTKKIEQFNKPRFKKEIEPQQPKINVANKLSKVIQSAISDSAKRPAAVISTLSPYFQQRAWMQISDKDERIKIRTDFQILLVNAYKKRNKIEEADKVNAVIDAEKKLFNE